MSQLNPTLITFIFYIIAMVGIGLYAYKATTDFSDYILGGRSLGSVVTALSAGASDMSGWLLMGLPGAIYLSGLSEAWIAIGLVIGAWLNWFLVAGRLRVHTEIQNNALTLPDYFTSRLVIVSVFYVLFRQSSFSFSLQVTVLQAWLLAHVCLKASLAGITPLHCGLARLRPSPMFVLVAFLQSVGPIPSKLD